MMSFKRFVRNKKILAGVLLLAVIGFIGAIQENAAQKDPKSLVAKSHTPHYQTINVTHQDRFDSAPTFYVLIDPVNDRNGLKQISKLVVQSIATKYKTTTFSAELFDNRTVLNTAYNRTTPSTTLEGQQWAEAQSLHLTTIYQGGMNINTGEIGTSPDSYQLLYYPSADKSNKIVGKYVGHEQWKPRI